jgi:hypothetical protein
VQVERILWRDAHDVGSGEWVDPVQQSYECLVVSAGIVVAETELYVVLTHSMMGESARGLFCIPKACILERVLASTGAPVGSN